MPIGTASSTFKRNFGEPLDHQPIKVGGTGTPPQLSITPDACHGLSLQAREFWTGATAALAHDLNLVIRKEPAESALVVQPCP